jgi:CubicO group peptidase (beta-lactamase class C family)
MTEPASHVLSRFAAGAVLLAVLAGTASAQSLVAAAPETVGLSAERLARAETVVRAAIDRGDVAGAVTLVARDGKLVHLAASGRPDVDRPDPMRPDTLFLLASMTKPVTSVAALILYEDGRLLLSDPISKFLPEFADMQVLGEGTAAGGDSPPAVPARRRITVRDLLTHRSGLTYGAFDNGPAGRLYREAKVVDGFPERDTLTQAENVATLARVPLVHQPGTRWRYGLSTDVLGRLVEVVSGQSLEDFMRERIFAPLAMRETSFFVPDAALDRLAWVHTKGEDGRLRRLRDGERIGEVTVSRARYRGSRQFLSGGAGLIGTATDYARFLQMLLDKGQLDGVRILSRKSVELMTVSHTSDLTPSPLGPGAGFGLGVAVTTDLGGSAQLGSVGAYRWGGVFGTDFWVDPRERLIGVLMIQLYPNSEAALGERFKAMVYQAIER